MAFTDKLESANEAQDHSQPLDNGGFFSLNDVIMAGRQQLTRSEHLLAADTRRNARNLLASAKLLVLVVIVSLAMGVAAWAFLASLNIATDYREHHAWIYALLPVVGVATAWVYKNHGLAAKRGNNLVIDSALGTRLIHMRMAVLTFVCSTLTHLTGGSAGREGAAVQIGGTIASNISSLAHLKKHDHHDLMLAGISSAFGAVFGSPLAGAFFGMEMCFIGKIDYTAGIYCLVASFTGYFTSLALGTEYEANVIASVPAMTPKTVVIVVVSAIIFGLTARLFAWSVRTVKSLYDHFITNYLVRALVGALVVLAAYAMLAGAFFGMEMCFIGKIDYTAGIYCLVASFTGYFTSLALGTEYEANVIASVPAMTPKTVVIVVVSAIIFGLTARLFAWSVRTVKSLYDHFITNYLVRALVGALVVLAAYAMLDAWKYAGLATWLSGAGFAGNTTLADAAIKLVVTALTLGAGFQGGEVTPLFGIGAALGGWIGCLTGLDPSFLAALGMLGVFCAGLNVPITTCMMAIDLFHGTAAGFFIIVAFISYLAGGHRGVYPAQRIISPKRRSLIVDEGGTVADAIERHNNLIE